MSGVVITENGNPLQGARVTVDLGLGGSNSATPTDAEGRYKVSFVPGGKIHYPNLDPVGTEDAVGFAVVEASGFERYSRFIPGTDPLIQNFRIRRVRRIAAGESVRVTVAPDDSVCDKTVWPGRELICEIVHVVPNRGGMLRVEVVPIIAGSAAPILEVGAINGIHGTGGNPVSLQAVAGDDYQAIIELPAGFREDQSFLLTTSLR